jgi:DNA repair protein RecN (Recombination protein N)
LARRLERELSDLAMEQARFEARMHTANDEGQWTSTGIDTVEFFLSANVGEEPRPLVRIVSGGELSRVMLALKTLAASADQAAPAKTLIFDEVDAGIGGRVATVVGEKLASLGAHHQVLCITHLPQVAAAARTHFLIQKHVRGRRTITAVQKLARSERVDELARMMGGADAGERARSGAHELLDAAGAKGEDRAKAKGESLRERKRK